MSEDYIVTVRDHTTWDNELDLLEQERDMADHYGILNESEHDHLLALLREHVGGGHPRFAEITLNELILHKAKNGDYSSGGDPLGNFDRVSTILKLYPDLDLADRKVVALVYMLKQVDATLWGLNAKVEHKVEGLFERLQDVSCYSKLVMCMLKDEDTKW